MDPWSRGREVARDVLRSLPKLENMSIFCHRKGIEIFCHLILNTSGQMFFSQTPGRRPPYITGLRVNSVTLGSVGAPNERAPLRGHDAIAVSAARCLTRTRIADQVGGFHEHWAGFARAIKFRVSCPGEFKICREHRVVTTLCCCLVYTVI